MSRCWKSRTVTSGYGCGAHLSTFLPGASTGRRPILHRRSPRQRSVALHLPWWGHSSARRQTARHWSKWELTSTLIPWSALWRHCRSSRRWRPDAADGWHQSTPTTVSRSSTVSCCSRSIWMLEAAARGPARPIHVSELTRYVKYLLENDELLAALSVQGEICELSHSAAGHVYFTLKDAGSQVPCVMLRRQALQQRDQIAALRKGLSVVVHGSMTVYEVRGSYQIYAERVVSLGEGAFAQRFQALRDKLEREGLFAPERKRPLPTHPRKIALVTSPRSQAYHDVLHRLGTQYPFVTVIEAGVSVQGDGAADEIVMALDIINRLTDAELILLVRGGGSPEDLAAFNDERLARAIYASRTPVVTGIGHETDHTIADFVADRRAATPSLAA